VNNSKIDKEKQLNNAGFSLLELLVAVVIMMILSIPLLLGFVASARTNREAKILMVATDSAENMMENFQLQTVEELQTRYSTSSQNTVSVSGNTIEFDIRNPGDFPINLPNGYYMHVTANPDLYPNANSLNLSDFKPVSVVDSAVFTMSAGTDDTVYDRFMLKHQDVCPNHNDPGGCPKGVTRDTFKQNLFRTIKIDISKQGVGTDAEGNTFDLVRVLATTEYKLNPNGDVSILAAADRVYTTPEKELYNNALMNVPLESVFVLYQPRYKAAQALDGGDAIEVKNVGNVETNVFVVAQKGAEDEGNAFLYTGSKGLRLTVIEEPVTASLDADTEGAITLFTNLNNGAPYTSTDVSKGELTCKLIYKKESLLLEATDNVAKSILSARDLDGKALDGTLTKKRIYKIITTVYDNNGNQVVSMDGTKVE